MLHKDIPVGADSSHPPGYVQAGDPGAVGANKVWIDTSGGTGAWVTKIRNAADSGWETLGSAVSALNDLSDVVITAGASGDILRHNGTNWVDAAGIVGTDITSGTVPTARLGSGTADATTFLRGDQTYAAPPGGSGPALSYLGYNTIGGSVETMVNLRAYMKKITVPSNGILMNISAYLDSNAAINIQHFGAAVYSDSAGSPLTLLAVYSPFGTGAASSVLSTGGGAHVPRWFAMPISFEVTAGDYWIAVMGNATGMGDITYDGSGGDRYYTAANTFFTDAGFYAITTTTNKYSIRAAFLPTA